MADGFTSYEGNAVLWIVYHNQGTTHVHATSEAIALQRFMAKYPKLSVRQIIEEIFVFAFCGEGVGTGYRCQAGRGDEGSEVPTLRRGVSPGPP